MTKKQRAKAIKTFKGELLYKGWKVDRHGNYLFGDERVKLTAQTWRYERKVNKVWTKIAAYPLNELTEGCAPNPPIPRVAGPPGIGKSIKGLPNGTDLEAPPEVKTVGKASRKVVTKHEAERSTEPLKVKVELSEAANKKLESMAFKQVQTGSRLDVMEKTMTALVKTIETMAGTVQSELHRIKSRPVVDAEPVFYHKMFNRISVRLRKRAIDVMVEDLHDGVKRKRVFRCNDWTRVEHLMTYRTMTEGIEELEVKAPVKRKGFGKKVAKKVAKKAPTKPKSIEDIRHEMERDGIPNTVIASGKTKTAYYDTMSDAEQRAVNRSREKAERLIVKLCSAGGPFEGAKDAGLIDALHANGFDRQVAFHAAMNCGRITDPSIIRQHQPKRKRKVDETSNEY